MEAGKNSVIYMRLISGPNKADDTCGPTTVTGTMDRGFTVYSKLYYIILLLTTSKLHWAVFLSLTNISALALGYTASYAQWVPGTLYPGAPGTKVRDTGSFTLILLFVFMV
jgi:hypothetical protein